MTIWARFVRAVLCSTLLSVCFASSAHAQMAPANDNFLFAHPFNTSDAPLTKQQWFSDKQDLRSASVQENLLAPCAVESCAAGMREFTSCGPAGFGNTVWYRFYPAADGAVGLTLQTEGFSPVVSLMRLAADGGPGKSICWYRSGSWNEVWGKVSGGVGYAVQIGGRDDKAGQLDLDMFYSPRAPRTVSNFKVAYTVTRSGSKFKLSKILLRGVTRGDWIQFSCNECRNGRSRKFVRRGGTVTIPFRPAATISPRKRERGLSFTPSPSRRRDYRQPCRGSLRW